MKIILSLITLILFSSSVFAADIKSLTRLFTENFNSFYEYRMCGENIRRLITAASENEIDFSNSYVLKVEGGGFLETSGFYTRGYVNQRKMLGYFHYILVADGYVFDFDLDEPLVLKIEDYIRLQFMPPYLPYRVFNIDMDPLVHLPGWTLTRFEAVPYMRSKLHKTWSKRMSDFIDIGKTSERERVR